jgi:hypothetical protein
MPVEVLTVEANYVGASLDKGLKGAQKELADTAKEANKLDSSLAKGLTKGSNTAGQSLQNLGRIAQDAPFGFIGIQNNINPLLESFQRLKVETGSTGGALKALAGSLVGAGGLGLAVSVATGLLTVLAQQGFFKTEKAADSAAEANKKYKESVDSIFNDVAKEASGVAALIAVLKSETETRERKISALKELQQINPEIFNGLKLEKNAVVGLDDAYKGYLESLKTVIAAKIKQKQLEDIVAKILKLEGKTEVGVGKVSVEAIEKQLIADNLLSSAAIGNAQRRTAAKTKELRNLQNDANTLQSELTLLSEGIDIKITKDKGAGVKKDLQTISDVLTQLEKEIAFLNKKEIAFNTNESKGKISAFFSTAEKLIKDFNVDPKNTIITKLFGRAADVKIQDTLKLLERITANQFIPPPIEIPIQLIPPLPGEFIFSNIEKFLKVAPITSERLQKEAFLLGKGFNVAFVKGLNDGQLTKAIDELTARIIENQQIVTEVLGSFAEGIGKSIATGSSFISSSLSGILNIIGDFLIKLGKAAILQSNLIKAISAGNPIAGLAAGLAAVIAGSILKNIQLPAFATGGIAPGGSILVGERGPEIITAPRGATITPNAQTNAMLSGAGGGTVVFRIQGRELVGVLNNTNATLGRNGQG